MSPQEKNFIEQSIGECVQARQTITRRSTLFAGVVVPASLYLSTSTDRISWAEESPASGGGGREADENHLIPDGQVIVGMSSSADYGTILISGGSRVAEIRQGELTTRPVINIAGQRVCGANYTTDEKHIVVWGGQPGESGWVRIYPISEQVPRWKIEVDGDWVVSADVRMEAVDGIDQFHILAASGDGNIIYQTIGKNVAADDSQSFPGGRLMWRPHTKSILAVRWLVDDLLVSAGLDQAIRISQVADQKVIRTLANHTNVVNDLDIFRPESGFLRLVSVGQDRSVRFWYPQQGRMLRFSRLDSVPSCVRWLPDGEFVAVGCRDGSVKVIRFSNAQVVSDQPTTLRWVDAVSVIKDGPNSSRRLAIGNSLGQVSLQWLPLLDNR